MGTPAAIRVASSSLTTSDFCDAGRVIGVTDALLQIPVKSGLPSTAFGACAMTGAARTTAPSAASENRIPLKRRSSCDGDRHSLNGPSLILVDHHL